jgi:hypothetical protein
VASNKPRQARVSTYTLLTIDAEAQIPQEQRNSARRSTVERTRAASAV